MKVFIVLDKEHLVSVFNSRESAEALSNANGFKCLEADVWPRERIELYTDTSASDDCHICNGPCQMDF